MIYLNTARGRDFSNPHSEPSHQGVVTVDCDGETGITVYLKLQYYVTWFRYNEES